MGFTGIVQDMGTVSKLERAKEVKLWDGSIGNSCTFTIKASDKIISDKTYVGESICVEGVCLTVVSFDLPKKSFQVQAAGHTLDVTMLGDLVENSPVNLEKACTVGQDISGHDVQGHVDDTLTILAKEQDRDNLWVTFKMPHKLRPLIVEKGYVAIGGASLTVCNVKKESFQVMLIPHTVQAITLPKKPVGGRVNVEAHVIGKYIQTQLKVMLEQEMQRTNLIAIASLTTAVTAVALSIAANYYGRTARNHALRSVRRRGVCARGLQAVVEHDGHGKEQSDAPGSANPAAEQARNLGDGDERQRALHRRNDGSACGGGNRNPGVLRQPRIERARGKNLENGSFAQCLREPYGVCAAIVAWNYPFNMALYKASILLAAGNSIVMKPSSKTPINTMGLASLFTEAGLPDGVFNVVQGGSEQGSALCEHPGVDKISFTGSTPVGQKILKMAANTIKPCTLELGGKSPLIVFEDADIIPAVKAAMIANFYSAGEICTNGTRIFVHENIYDEFLAAFIQHSDALRVGDPQDPQTQIGALVDVGHADSVRDAITKAQQEGATLVTGGNEAPTGLAPHLNPLAFMRPTIFADVQDDHTLAKEEVFGPVASVFKFSDTEEVLFRANNTPYGLASGFFTRDLKRAHYVASKLQSGIVWCNTYNIYAPNVPVGGYKESGFGREFGEEALDHASHTKSVYFEMNPAAGGTDF
ncbi:unnamed protein product [Amoebophrya sp. A120]|nr:unnamed protein product [Amoebophrya sp. A120]|eukprot:GSA120T00003756001.1